MGVEEERAIGERKLESSIGSVFGTTGATTRPVWMTGSARVIRFAGVVGLVRMVGFVGVVGSVRMVGSMRVVGPRGVVGFLWVVGFLGVAGLVRMVGLVGVVWVMRRVRGFGPIGAAVSTVAVGVSHLARNFNLHRLRPISVHVAF